MNCALAFMFTGIGFMLGLWFAIGTERYYDYQAKVRGWKQRAEWWEEDHGKKAKDEEPT